MTDRTTRPHASGTPDRPSPDRRWGATVARHRRLVLAVWLVVLLGCVASYPYLQSRLRAPDYGVNGADSTQVTRLLQRHFSAQGAEQDVIVFHSRAREVTDPGYRTVVDRALRAARHSAGTGLVVGPFDRQAHDQISGDRHAAIAVVGMHGDAAQRAAHAADLQAAVRATGGASVTARLTGYSPMANDLGDVEGTDAERAESIGIPVALGVLLLALGAFVAALLPLLLAGAGLLLAFGALAALTLVFGFDAFVTTIVTMIGTGIGIDYSLFIVSRFREELARRGVIDRHDREAVAASVGVAVATSGRTVTFSGGIVMISLCSLFVVNAPIFREIAIGVFVVVACTLAVALTLLPAILAALGPWVNRGGLPARMQPADTRPDGAGHGAWARWAHAVMRHPVPAAVFAAAVLIVVALPVTGVRYGIDLGTSSLGATPSGAAQRVLARSFSPGVLSPIQITVTGSGDTALDATGRERAGRLGRTLAADRRVAAVSPTPGDGRILLNIVPVVPIDSTAAADLVRYVRGDVAPRIAAHGGPRVLVGGATAEFVDLSQETSAKFPVVLALVLGLSLLFLLVVFRSLVVPVKAVLMNLLATGAALGGAVAVFQWGYGADLLGFTGVGFVQVYLPITVFALLFGLSMDYEVFLLGRMRESWGRTRDNRAAVATGIEHTARPIAAAAAIMVVVFGSFLTADVLELKEFGFALAVAIALDATLVRLVAVPALMRLLGAGNWWLPTFLARRLPRIHTD